MIYIMLILGAICNRIRGGLLNILFSPDKDSAILKTIGKFGTPIIFGAMMVVITHNWYALFAGALGMFIGASWGWGKYISGIIEKSFDVEEEEVEIIDKLVMKTNDHPVLRSVAALSLRGLMWTSVIAASLASIDIGYLLVLPLGLLMGPIYYTTIQLRGMYGWGLGEYVWGAILWATIGSI